MIYCNIKGGLGNILFQVAAGLSFSIENNTRLSIPNLNFHLSYLNKEVKHNPNLNHSHEYDFLFKGINSIPFPKNKSIEVKKFPFHYDDSLNVSNNDWIDGYFQSEKYFYKYRNRILKQFSLSFYNRFLIFLKYPVFFSFKKTTSIHVRRGDYLNSEIHITQDYEYYNKSIEELDSITEVFIIFSDDIAWCKKHFIGNKFVFIENEKDYIELFLMSFCNNNIISNSSFSWWGAWLNKNKSKKVIAPKNWILDSLIDTCDLLPNDWIKI